MRAATEGPLTHPRRSQLFSGALRRSGFPQFGTRFGTRFYDPGVHYSEGESTFRHMLPLFEDVLGRSEEAGGVLCAAPERVLAEGPVVLALLRSVHLQRG